MAADFPPIPDADWPEQIADLADGYAGRLNVYRVMAHHPDLLRAWGGLRQQVVIDTALGPERSEVAILRTGHRMGSRYEWQQHISRARALGMTDARIASIAGPLQGVTPQDAVIAGAVDQLFADKRLSKDRQRALVDLVGVKGMFDLIATVGMYSTLGYILNSFDTPLDDDIAAELAARPFTADQG